MFWTGPGGTSVSSTRNHVVNPTSLTYLASNNIDRIHWKNGSTITFRRSGLANNCFSSTLVLLRRQHHHCCSHSVSFLALERLGERRHVVRPPPWHLCYSRCQSTRLAHRFGLLVFAVHGSAGRLLYECDQYLRWYQWFGSRSILRDRLCYPRLQSTRNEHQR